ncbi:MAG TPA: glycosyltransferase family 2 protein, partial [Candidatus Aminicenantes bacterium]|nr:glycosyltransferase family 2 protein [Candidatus Aminicenantes bacterium]
MKISAVVITYNEEANIEAALRSLEGVVSEIVVVDS